MGREREKILIWKKAGYGRGRERERGRGIPIDGETWSGPTRGRKREIERDLKEEKEGDGNEVRW